MEPMETWEKVLLGVLALLVLLWFRPGIKQMLERSRQAKKDWPAVILPWTVKVPYVPTSVVAPPGAGTCPTIE